MRKRNEIADEDDDEMLSAEEVNDWWHARVLRMGRDVTEMPMRIAKRLCDGSLRPQGCRQMADYPPGSPQIFASARAMPQADISIHSMASLARKSSCVGTEIPSALLHAGKTDIVAVR
jgi:hypothetical protein